MRFLRFVWKLFVMASVFGIGYIIGREHSFEEEEMWEEEADKADKGDNAEKKTESGSGSDDNEVEFEFEDADAKKVSVVGNFNDWNKPRLMRFLSAALILGLKIFKGLMLSD